MASKTSEAKYVQVYLNSEARSCNHCYSGKAVSITPTACVFIALGIQHAMRMRHNVICGLPHSTMIFHIISQTPLFKKKKSLNTKRMFRVPLQLLSETFFILRRYKRDKIENVYWFACKVPFIIFRF